MIIKAIAEIDIDEDGINSVEVILPRRSGFFITNPEVLYAMMQEMETDLWKAYDEDVKEMADESEVTIYQVDGGRL